MSNENKQPDERETNRYLVAQDDPNREAILNAHDVVVKNRGYSIGIVGAMLDAARATQQATKDDEWEAFEATFSQRAEDLPNTFDTWQKACAWQRSVLAATPSPVAGSAGQAPIYQVSDGASWNDTDWLEFQSTPAEDRRIVHEVSGDGSGVSLPPLDGLVKSARATIALPDADRSVINMLIVMARTAWWALDNSEEGTGDDGRFHAIGSADFDAMTDALDKLEELPDDKPGYTLGAAEKAEWALRNLLAAPTAPSLTTDAGAVLTDALIRKIATQYCEHDAEGRAYNILRYECEEDFFNLIRALLAAHPTDQCMSDAARDVLAERVRQVSGEGWDAAHDDGHQPGTLAAAASAYALDLKHDIERHLAIASEQASRITELEEALVSSRAATLEEAAKLVENEYGFHNIADAVRARKQDREMNDG